MRLIDRLLPKARDLDQFHSTTAIPTKAVPFIWHFVSMLRLSIGTATLLYFIGAVAMTLESLFFGKIVGALSDTADAAVASRLALLVTLYLLICQLGMRLCYQVGHRIEAYATNVLPHLVRRDMAAYLFKHSYKYFQEDFAGSLAGKIVEMPQAVQETVIDAMGAVLLLGTMMIVSLGIFASVHWTLGILAGVFFILQIGLGFLRVPVYSALSAEASTAIQSMRGRYLDSISNILLVKLFAKERSEIARFSIALKETGTATQIQEVSRVVWWGWAHLLNALLQAAVLFQAIHLYRTGVIDIAGVTSVLALGASIMANIWWMLQTGSVFFRRFALIDNALTSIIQDHEIADSPAATPLILTNPTVELRGVTFAYPNRPVFDDLFLTIPAGQKVGLVGSSGAGKSTLVQLLLRLSDVQGGTITVGGQDIRSVTQSDLRNAVTVIPQATELMHRSVGDNIRYGDLDATLQQMEAAARRAHIHETIQSLRDGQGNTGYEALVGERGVKLSGGQRQRVAIARAFLKDAPILILDEATSALDSESERLIQDSFRTLFEGRTVIAIAHRLSTIAHLDRIIVLDQGRIVEDGTHAALLAGHGLYAKLWSLQSDGFFGTHAADA